MGRGAEPVVSSPVLRRVALLAMAIVMAAVGAIGLASSQGTNVTERIREFGIMRTIGAPGGAIIRNILVVLPLLT